MPRKGASRREKGEQAAARREAREARRLQTDIKAKASTAQEKVKEQIETKAIAAEQPLRPTQTKEWVDEYLTQEEFRRAAIANNIIASPLPITDTELKMRILALQHSATVQLALTSRPGLADAWLYNEQKRTPPQRHLKTNNFITVRQRVADAAALVTDYTFDETLAEWFKPQSVVDAHPNFQKNFVIFPFLVPSITNFRTVTRWCAMVMDMEMEMIKRHQSNGEYASAWTLREYFELQPDDPKHPANSNLFVVILWNAALCRTSRVELSHQTFGKRRAFFALLNRLENNTCAICINEMEPRQGKGCPECMARICDGCIRGWFALPQHREQESASCPSCRHEEAYFFCGKCFATRGERSRGQRSVCGNCDTGALGTMLADMRRGIEDAEAAEAAEVK